jgi:hypothetical protein
VDRKKSTDELLCQDTDMPAKKTRRREPKSPAVQPARQEEPPNKGSGRSGRGADSALEHLIAQEKVRTRKPDNH